MVTVFNPAKLIRFDPWIVKAYYALRYFFRYQIRKSHMNVVKEAFMGDPWDEGFLIDLEYVKIKEMLEWTKRKGHYDGVEYAIRDMRICLSLLETMRGEKETFHYDGNLLEEDTDDPTIKRIVPSEDFKYVCDVYVNTRNADRFIGDEKLKKYYLEHQGDLYELKARHLYHKIRAYKEENWWT